MLYALSQKLVDCCYVGTTAITLWQAEKIARFKSNGVEFYSATSTRTIVQKHRPYRLVYMAMFRSHRIVASPQRSQ